MKIKYQDGIFASMTYLDEMLDENKEGYPNPRTENYYETLKEIRSVQNCRKVPADEIYKRLGKTRRKKAFETIEYGYYTANIHYYLYESCSEYKKSEAYKDSLNRRILFFLNNANIRALSSYLWFPLNFPDQYLRFLEYQYGKKRSSWCKNKRISDEFPTEMLIDFTDKFGNNEEKEIADTLHNVINKCYEDYYG
ncbi:MAG: hypothetical protein IJJ00_01440 [Erysipelotrichaceae bacterium]|nr:hypothetical protein [Erysipelotrichaceae bacterium]